jgi:hypothetical protein
MLLGFSIAGTWSTRRPLNWNRAGAEFAGCVHRQLAAAGAPARIFRPSSHMRHFSTGNGPWFSPERPTIATSSDWAARVHECCRGCRVPDAARPQPTGTPRHSSGILHEMEEAAKKALSRRVVAALKPHQARVPAVRGQAQCSPRRFADEDVGKVLAQGAIQAQSGIGGGDGAETSSDTCPTLQPYRPPSCGPVQALSRQPQSACPMKSITHEKDPS